MPTRKPASMRRTASRKPSVSKADPLATYREKRDFSRTAEPRGRKGRSTTALRFVIQKHAATRLHYDLRLELDGVMKSWAVPKGPSLDPSTKRLAMEVEDHPVEYNSFEGIIPRGQYGGGTVMLWDQGVYTYGDDDLGAVEGLRRGLAKGELKIVLLGERLKGGWMLIRTSRGKNGKHEWLLFKQKDPYAKPRSDVTRQFTTSVVSGRSMDEIAAEKDAVWQSNRP